MIKVLEKYLKTDIRYLVKEGSWTALAYIVQVGIGVINTIILANFLAKELLGTYQFILAMAGLLGVLTLTGMGTAITRAVAQGHDETFRSGVYIKLRWSIGIFIGALAIASYYWVQNDINLALAFLFVALTVPATESFVLYESYLQGKKAFKDILTLGFWRKPIPVATLLITLYFTNHVPTLVGVYLGSTLLSTFLVYLSVINKYQPPSSLHTETISYSKQLSLMNILGRLAEHVDKVLLWYLLGPIAVASFTLAQLVSKYSGGLASVATFVALPKLSQRDLPTIQSTLPRKVWLFTLTLIPFVILYIAFIPIIFVSIFPDYPESILLTQILGITIFFVPFTLYGQVLLGHKQTKALYIMSILAPLIKICIIASLILIFGIWGAVYGVIIGEGVSSFLQWYFFKTALVENQQTVAPPVPE